MDEFDELRDGMKEFDDGASVDTDKLEKPEPVKELKKMPSGVYDRSKSKPRSVAVPKRKYTKHRVEATIPSRMMVPTQVPQYPMVITPSPPCSEPTEELVIRALAHWLINRAAK